MHKVSKGLNLPISGAPAAYLQGEKYSSKVALIGPDYIGMKPTMLVKVGDSVKKGQAVFEDKKNPGVFYTAPAAGKVVEVNRGEKRAFLSMVIQKEGSDEVTFKTFSDSELDSGNADQFKEVLLSSGAWTAIRTRPFSKVPPVDQTPSSIFVTAMDTNPLSFDPAPYINKHREAFEAGLKVLVAFSEKTFLCSAAGSELNITVPSKTRREEFKGPHPAGLAGTHINYLDPVSESKTVWYIGWQDVIAIGMLVTTGKLYTDRYISIGGPRAKLPRIVKSEYGACLTEITSDETVESGNRIVSGSVLSGRKSEEGLCYLGRFHNQISILKEDNGREFLGWQMPGFGKHSITRLFLSFPFKFRKFDMGTNLNGSHRAFVPVGSFEKVMPLDIMSSPFVRAMLSNDIEAALEHGLLDLDEEDLGLFNYVCPGKTDYGPILRDMLTTYEKEG